MLKNLFGLVLIAVTICACASTKNVKTEIMTQGIIGTVVEIVGNQMPMKGEDAPKPKGIQAEILVYEKTNISQVAKDQASGLFTNITTKKIATVVSDSAGKFSITLPVGVYSLFVKIGNSYYANLFNQFNDIQTVVVNSGTITTTTIRINRKAVY
jgi:CheY-specific phosphatase CheX